MNRYPTGVFLLDSLLNGGFPAGVSEIYGSDACGKTTLCLSVMREASLRGLNSCFISTEGLPDKEYFQACGLDDCMAVVPYSGEAGIDAAFHAILGGAKVVVIDSVTSLGTILDDRAPLGSYVPYSKRRLAYHGLSVLRETAKSKGALVLVTSQIRTHFGRYGASQRAALHDTIGPLCDTRLRIRRDETRNQFGKLFYIKAEIQLKKSLISPPNTKTYGFIFNGKGFDRGFELLRYLLATGSLEKRGAYIKSASGDTVGQGFFEAAKTINENFDYYRSMADGS